MDMKKLDREKRRIDCYNSSQKILLVGEGDFSFSACLARAFCTAKNMIATSYLDEDSVFEKHWTSVPHLEELERLGCLLLYKIDVYNMHTHPILWNMKLDIIIFNFPHAGHYDYLRESNRKLIQMHRELVGGFFKSASKMLSEGGEVHIRHRDDFPYDKWGVVSLAGEAGLKLKEKVLFDKSEYPGYHHKRGGDINTNKTFPIGYAFTFKFVLDLPKVDDHLKNDQVCVSELKDHGSHMKDDDHDELFVHMLERLCLLDDVQDDDDDDNYDDDMEENDGGGGHDDDVENNDDYWDYDHLKVDDHLKNDQVCVSELKDSDHGSHMKNDDHDELFVHMLERLCLLDDVHDDDDDDDNYDDDVEENDGDGDGVDDDVEENDGDDVENEENNDDYWDYGYYDYDHYEYDNIW